MIDDKLWWQLPLYVRKECICELRFNGFNSHVVVLEGPSYIIDDNLVGCNNFLLSYYIFFLHASCYLLIEDLNIVFSSLWQYYEPLNHGFNFANDS